MCGIVGMAGNFSKEMLQSVLESIKHRGEDYSDIFIDKENKIGLGHNLLSIFSLIDENKQLSDNFFCSLKLVFLILPKFCIRKNLIF